MKDRILWILSERGPVSKGYLARCLHIKMGALDPILMELEHAGKIKLTETKGKLVVGLKG